MALADWQYRYTSPTGDSLTVGDGTPFEVVEIDGLEGFNTRIGDRELPRGHGNVSGLHLATGRQILLGVEFSGDDIIKLDERWAMLVGTFALSKEDQGTLTFKQPGRVERQVSCRPTVLGRRLTNEEVFLSTQRIALVASDPRIYSSVLNSVTVPLYTPGGGAINYPQVNYPKNWPAGVALEAAVTNAGDADAPIVIRVHGPTSGTVTGWTLRNQTTGEQVNVTADVAVGQILTFDSGAYLTGSGGLVVGLDGTTRYGDWEQPRVALTLPPGDSVLRFTTTGTATVVPCVVTWRDTWLA